MVAVLAAGCNNSHAPAMPATPAAQTTKPDEGNGPTATTPSTPEATTPGANPAIPKAPPISVKIDPPQADQWRPAEPEWQKFAAEADAAFAGLKSTYAQTELAIKNSEMTGYVTSEINIQDSGNYHLQYFTPAKPTIPDVMLSHNNREYVLEGKAPKVNEQSLTASDAELVKQFPAQFPKDVWLGYARGEKTWSRVLSALFSGKNGYKATFERKEMAVGSESRPFYRVVATNVTDPSDQWELRFDGQRKLPLTIKIVHKDAKGQPSEIQWNARWSFSKPIDTSLFIVPGDKAPAKK